MVHNSFLIQVGLESLRKIKVGRGFFDFHENK